MCSTRLAENSSTGRKKSPNLPSAHHRTALSVYIFATKACIDNQKKNLNSNISSTSSQYGELRPLTVEIGLGVWGHPNKFQWVTRLVGGLLQRCRSPEANQTLHDVWPSPGLVHYVGLCIFGGFSGLLPLTEFCPVQNSLYVQVLRSPVLPALLHGTPAAGVSETFRRAWYTVQGIELRNFRRDRHLYSPGRPSRWASAQCPHSSFIYVLQF